MSDIATREQLSPAIVESLVLEGNLDKMTPHQRVAYYVHRCEALGVDPGEQPFQLLRLNGRLVLYATKACANALTRVNRLSVEVRSISIDDGLVTVTARATAGDGRFADDVGVLDLNDSDSKKMGRPNATMKAVTKAKRRAVLALVGLGVLDDSEVDDIRGATRVDIDVGTGEIIDTVTVDKIGPRCSGKAQALGDGLDSKCRALAEAKGAKPDAVLLWAMKASGVDRERYELADGHFPRPWDLSAADGMKVREALVAKLAELGVQEPTGLTVAQLHVEAQRLYAQLCVLEPADYTTSGWPAEFASLAELDAWPDSPTVKHYTEVIAGLRIVLADVSASRDAEDPEQSSEVIIDVALADDDIPF